MDNDAALYQAPSIFLEVAGYREQTYHSAEAFLEREEDTTDSVMLLDQRMTGMSDLDLQAELVRRCIDFPIFFNYGTRGCTDVREGHQGWCDRLPRETLQQ